MFGALLVISVASVIGFTNAAPRRGCEMPETMPEEFRNDLTQERYNELRRMQMSQHMCNRSMNLSTCEVEFIESRELEGSCVFIHNRPGCKFTVPRNGSEWFMAPHADCAGFRRHGRRPHIRRFTEAMMRIAGRLGDGVYPRLSKHPRVSNRSCFVLQKYTVKKKGYCHRVGNGLPWCIAGSKAIIGHESCRPPNTSESDDLRA